MSSSLQRLNSVASAARNRVGSPSGRYDVQLELEQVLAQEDDHLGPGQDADVGRQAELERVLADQAVAEGVERRDRRVRVAVGHELVDPDGHLLGGLVREGQGQDLATAARAGSR